MARKLKTYTTSAGFFDLAVAAPSMKAALEAWGSKGNLFHQGFAKESEDAKVVAATMAKPGVVLRRAVGSSGAYNEHAELPRNIPVGSKAIVPKAKKAAPKAKAVDDKDAQRAARAYEKEEKRRSGARRREEAAREKERARREQAIAAAEAALAEAAREHEALVAKIEAERTALDRRAGAEEQRWRKQEEALETALRKARSISYLRTV
jgi:hypothetical protein